MGDLVERRSKHYHPWRYWGRVLLAGWENTSINSWSGLGVSLAISVAVTCLYSFASKQPTKDAMAMIGITVAVFSSIIVLAFLHGLLRTPPKLHAEILGELEDTKAKAGDDKFWRIQSYREGRLDKITDEYRREKYLIEPDPSARHNYVNAIPPMEYIKNALAATGESWDPDEVRQIQRSGRP